MIKIAIIVGSTRPGRNGEAAAKWVYEVSRKRSDAEFELVDIKDFNLPLLDEPMPPIMHTLIIIASSSLSMASGVGWMMGSSPGTTIRTMRTTIIRMITTQATMRTWNRTTTIPARYTATRQWLTRRSPPFKTSLRN